MAGYEITAASNSSQPLSSSRKRFERFRDVVRLFLSEGNFSNSIRNESNESRNGGKLWERNYFQCGESFFREGEEGNARPHVRLHEEISYNRTRSRRHDTCYSFPLATGVLRPWISSWLDNSTKLHYKYGGRGGGRRGK